LSEHEDIYRRLVENSFAGIFIQQDGAIVYANVTAIRLIGAGSVDEVMAKPVLSFVHPDYRTLAGQRMASATREDQPITRLKYVSIHGSAIDVDAASGPFVWKNKPAIHVMFRDITERQRAEDALALATKKLIMLGSITRHDILNQLMILQGWLELSKEKVGDPAILEYILKEERAVNTIREQIEFTRNYENIGGQAPKWQVLSDTIRSAVNQLNSPGTDIDIAVNHIEVFADPILEKVFYNLMENSLRHGEHVTRMGFSVQESENGLTLTYCDNGAGISDEDKKILFQKGFGKHTGLGLFLSREILSITGMTIRETGVQGKGARFVITVPKGAYRFPEARSSP